MTDITLAETHYLMFTTRAFATGIPTVLAGSPVVSAYENDSVTQITAGITLGVDHDSVVGLNLLTVVATGANGYEAGKKYNLVITTGTVGGVSVVGEVVGSFSIESSAAFTRLGAPAGASVSADILVIDNFVDDLETRLTATRAGYLDNLNGHVAQTGDSYARIGAAGAGLTNIGTIATVTNLTNERGKYAMGAVWIGPAANTNTVSYVDGIATNPVSTIAAAKTIADALNLRRFFTVRTGVSQIGAAMTGYDFDGSAWSCTTTGGSRDVGTSRFLNANVTSGIFAGTTGSIWWDKCEFFTGVSVGISNMNLCTFAGTLTLIEAGSYDFIDCASIVAGSSAPVFDVPAGTVTISFRRWSGGIRITGITSGTTISIDIVSGGTVTLEGADGSVSIRGMATGVTDSRTGAPTLTTTAMVNRTTINAEVDAALADIHLDHLLATDYDPASKPGVATALFNELIESDAGVSRYTANALELAPTGGSAPTASEIAVAVWDEDATAHQTTGTFGQAIGDPGASTETLYKAIVTDPAGTNIAADIIAIKAETASILADTNELQVDWVNGGRLDLIVDDILADTAVIGAAGAGLTALATQASVNTIDDFLDTEIAAIKTKTDFLPSATAGAAGGLFIAGTNAATTITTSLTTTFTGNLTGSVGSVTGLTAANLDATISSRATPAQVNTEVLDVLNTDTFAEPAQGAPGATVSLVTKIGFLYKAWRNKTTSTATQYNVYNDDTTTIDHKSTLSDDGTTATKTEVVSGP